MKRKAEDEVVESDEASQTRKQAGNGWSGLIQSEQLALTLIRSAEDGPTLNEVSILWNISNGRSVIASGPYGESLSIIPSPCFQVLHER